MSRESTRSVVSKLDRICTARMGDNSGAVVVVVLPAAVVEAAGCVACTPLFDEPLQPATAQTTTNAATEPSIRMRTPLILARATWKHRDDSPYHRIVSTMWCPACRTEYRDGISRCADCGTDLVTALEPIPTRSREPHEMVTGPFLPDDDVVELMTTTAVEAEVTAANLRSAGIPATVFGVDAYSGYGAAFQNAQGARIMVRRRDVDAAASLVHDVVDQPPRPQPVWVRGVALFVLLLILIPVAAAYPQVLVAVMVIGVAVVVRMQMRRLGRKPSSGAS